MNSGRKNHSIITIIIANNNKCMYYCTCLHLHSFKYDGTKLYNTTEVVHVKYYIDGVSFLDICLLSFYMTIHTG